MYNKLEDALAEIQRNRASKSSNDALAEIQRNRALKSSNCWQPSLESISEDDLDE
ncbi:hypothetical protein LINGRAHAP2_LOCUS25485 [Linum grandiflorum]